ncbi:MAG: HAD-IC family P-type ATPase [Micromonosporaceae bacterium]|nr:HAD-IC family P-type ATPase [Micromonosporaceae bacterium]
MENDRGRRLPATGRHGHALRSHYPHPAARRQDKEGPRVTTSGLTPAEVDQRRSRGQSNVVRAHTSRTVWSILRANVFTRFNAIIGALLVVVLIFGPLQDALFGLVIVVNSAVGIVQEWRAKRKLDALALVEQAPVRVRRAGEAVTVPPSDVVVDDVVLLSAGEKVPVDGVVVESAGLEVDESLLTGEADPVAKAIGDEVRSGSFVVAGSGAFRAVHVGDEAYAQRLVASVRRFELSRSELMIGINRILRAITWVIVPLGVLLVISQLSSAGSLDAAMVGTVAGLVPTIPEGLVLMTSVAFAVGVIRLARRQCLVQELPAIEMLARVDTLCLDKTGTLTAPEMDLADIVMVDGLSTVDQQRARDALAALARLDEAPNATMRAITEAVPPADGFVASATVPFSSTRKYSAARFAERGAWCLGAPDVVLPADAPLRVQAERIAATGRRVLALGELPDGALPGGQLPAESVPPTVRPAALVVLRQRLRPDAAETLAYLHDEGVTMKIFSGDHAESVGAVAAQAGVPDAQSTVDARTLPTDTAGLTVALREHAVFGRVTPEQKRGFIDALRADGHTVAMTGDGVNDALAIRHADLGIAMGSGSPATRAVAKVVLLDNSFATLPRVLAEGRRVLGNIERVASLFLVKTMYSLVLAALVGVAHVPFPLLPRHTTLVGSLTIGIPGFFLALAPNTQRWQPGFTRRVLRRAVPAGLVAGVAAFVAYGLGRLNTASDQAADRSTAALTLFLAAAWMLALVARPYNWWRVALVAGVVVAFVVVATVPLSARFFALDFANLANVGIALVTAGVAAVLITVIHFYDNRNAAATT